jgi:hypothetical protein
VLDLGVEEGNRKLEVNSLKTLTTSSDFYENLEPKGE